MNENFNSNNIENDQYTMNIENSDYKDLINRLKEIKKTIALLENKYLTKF